jgi:hypothetical protein
VRAAENFLEGADGVLERNKLALITGEDLRDSERLRHETLNLTSPLDLTQHYVSQRIDHSQCAHLR